MAKVNKDVIINKIKEVYNLAVTHPRISYAIFLVIVFSLILLNTDY